MILHFGHDPRKHLLHRIDRLHPVVQEEALPAAADLAQDRFANQPLVEFCRPGSGSRGGRPAGFR